MNARLMTIMLSMAVIVAGCGKGAAKEEAAHQDEHGEEEGHDEHGEEASGMVKLTPEQVASAKIAIAPVERRAVTSEIIATGEMVPPDDGIARIGAKASGRVTKLTKGVGDQVTRGQALATIDSPDLGRAKADYIAAASAATVTRETADREKALFEKKIAAERDWRIAEGEATRARAEKEAAELRLHTMGVSDAQLRNLRADQHYASAVSIASPLDGVVVERPVTLGQMVEPQDTMFVVMDLRTVWVMVDVYERDLAQIAVGQKVSAAVEAWPATHLRRRHPVDRRGARSALADDQGPRRPRQRRRRAQARHVRQGDPGRQHRRAPGRHRSSRPPPSSATATSSIVFVPVGDTEFQLREVELGVRAVTGSRSPRA